ncbi:MAG: transposase [Tepidisphaeraceae bacterium]|jgi:transposase-like protein
MVRGTVEQTLNALLEAEADALCQATRYERSPEPRGHPREAVTLKVPKLSPLPFETAIIERYKRREICVEEAESGKLRNEWPLGWAITMPATRGNDAT